MYQDRVNGSETIRDNYEALGDFRYRVILDGVQGVLEAAINPQGNTLDSSIEKAFRPKTLDFGSPAVSAEVEPVIADYPAAQKVEVAPLLVPEPVTAVDEAPAFTELNADEILARINRMHEEMANPDHDAKDGISNFELTPSDPVELGLGGVHA